MINQRSAYTRSASVCTGLLPTTSPARSASLYFGSPSAALCTRAPCEGTRPDVADLKDQSGIATSFGLFKTNDPGRGQPVLDSQLLREPTPSSSLLPRRASPPPLPHPKYLCRAVCFNATGGRRFSAARTGEVANTHIWSSTPDPRLPYRPKITSRRHRQTRSLPRGTRSSAQRNPSPRALSTPPNTSSLLPRRRDRRSHGCSQNGRHRSPRPRGDLDHSMGYDRATAHTCSRKLLLRLVSSRAGRDQFQINAMQ